MKYLGLSLFILSSPAWAFTLVSQNSSQTGWGSKTVNYKLNSANCPANIGDILNAATGLWNTVATSRLTVKVDGASNTTSASLRGGTASDAPVIVCDPNFQANTGQNANSVPAVGFIGNQTSPINYGGIILNVQAGAQDNISNIPNTLAQVVIAHEMGHSLGLGHSADSAALMYWDASSKTHLALAQDDMDGITYLYPRNELGGDSMFGCGAIFTGHDDSRRGPFLPWTIFPFLLLPLLTVLTLKTRSRWEKVLA